MKVRPEEIAKQLASAPGGDGLPPVDRWHPERCGEIDIRIGRDGRWYYEGGEISRQPMIKLFSGILRRDSDGEYYLVTPAEKLRIQVDDAPFTAIHLDVQGVSKNRKLLFTTNVGDKVEADAAHPIFVEHHNNGEPAPYIRVRRNLDALISRSVYYELAGIAEARTENGQAVYEVTSNGLSFKL